MTPSGLLLGDRYHLADCIAVGGMGEVWRATDLVLRRPVAVKLLRSGCDGSDEDRARFRAEARHAGSLTHPGIARVYDYREANPPDPPYLVMELVDGPSLARLLERGPLSPARTMGVIAQAAAALQSAHAAGLVHRDVKPGNLLVGQDGTVKITDFGIAHAAGSASVTCPGQLTGTPAYLAPERAAGAPATPAADLYALGIVAYQCLTGRPPFEGEPLAVALAHIEQPLPPLPPRVPGGVAALVADLTAKDPRARPASAGEVADRADQLRDGLTRIAASPPGLPALDPAALDPALDASGPATPSRRVLTGLTALLVLGMAAAIVAAGWTIAGGLGPDRVLPSASAGPNAAGSHGTHHAAPARHRTGGATTVVHQSGPSGPQHPVSGSPTGKPEPSATPSSSGAPAATGAPSPKATPAATGTPSPTRSPAKTATPTPTRSPSRTGTPTPTRSPAQTGTPTPTGSPPQTGTPTPTGSPPQTGTATPTGSPPRTGTPTPAGSPAQTGSGTVVAAALPRTRTPAADGVAQVSLLQGQSRTRSCACSRSRFLSAVRAAPATGSSG